VTIILGGDSFIQKNKRPRNQLRVAATPRSAREGATLSLLLLSLGSTLFLLDDPSGRIYVGGAQDLIGLSLATLIPFFLRKTNIMELISLAMKFLILESVALIWVLLI
jgi:hypothetical protein